MKRKKMDRQLAWLMLAWVTMVTLTLAACSGKSAQEQIAEKVLEKATGNKAAVDLQKGKVTVKTGDGQSEITFGQAGSWPSDLPADVPAFLNGKVKAVTRAEQEGRKTWSVVLEGVETGALQNYAKNLETKGWKNMNTVTSDEGGMVQATKGNLMVMAVIGGKDKTASISVTTEGNK